ncbi:hypothetical protein EXE58_16285 [Nocardioides seonyuensis]|uniref:Uncharacterized protein n=1 Tax=Nocardioides seonyuensis TaxID=2518371 RepID=A0A4P7IJF8_9ACTN|nr:HGxxPAAW family protein [Nocardioides seonyuensis]QBX56850.1 hypothetical protein EXE58_16285 [Nocardioides seonyuensis]
MAHHGNTPAAWTAVAVAMVGFVVGSIALMLTPINLPMLYVGLALAAIALPVFLVMSRLGFNSTDH